MCNRMVLATEKDLLPKKSRAKKTAAPAAPATDDTKKENE